MKKIIFLLLLILVLTGCKSPNIILIDAPANIRLEDDFVIWDKVDEADFYTVLTGDKTYIVYSEAFSIYEFINGEYSLTVKAYIGTKESAYSSEFVFTINRTFEHPKNLRVEVDTLYWDLVEGAINYSVWINGVETVVESGNFLSLNDLEVNEIYRISVKAVFTNGISNDSNELIYHTFNQIIKTINLEINKNRAVNFFKNVDQIYDFDYVFQGSRLQSQDMFSFSQSRIVVNYRYLLNLEERQYIYKMITENGIVEIKVQILDEKKPYMLSQNTVFYQGEDLVFKFELFDGSFGKLSGQDIKSSEYQFVNDTLTISSKFIDDILDKEPTRKTIILSYDLSGEDSIIIGYIFINIQP